MPGTKPLITYSGETIAAYEAAQQAEDTYLNYLLPEDGNLSADQRYELVHLERCWKEAAVALFYAVNADLNRYRVGTP